MNTSKKMKKKELKIEYLCWDYQNGVERVLFKLSYCGPNKVFGTLRE